MSVKRVRSKRKPLSEDMKIGITIAIVSIIVLSFALPLGIAKSRKSTYIDVNRETTLNIFPPNTIEAVLSKVVNENGKILVEEERILINTEKVRSVKFDGTTLEITYNIMGDKYDLPNVEYSEWQEVMGQLEE